MSNPILRIKVLNPSLKELYINRPNFTDDSGVDLFCPIYYVIEKNSTHKIDFQIQCEMIVHTTEGIKNIPYLLIPRSSISKTPLRMSNSIGMIDKNYRGNICAYVDHTEYGVDKVSDTFILNKGQRLFQFVAPDFSPIKVELVDELSFTDRGEGGFGSTGK